MLFFYPMQYEGVQPLFSTHLLPQKLKAGGNCVRFLHVTQLFEIWELGLQIRHWNGSMVHKSIIEHHDMSLALDNQTPVPIAWHCFPCF